MEPIRKTSFANLEYANKKRVTRREKFLGEMEQVVPWQRLIELIEPHYPESGRVGRPPMGLERVLRMYLLQQWYGLSDGALEDALYDSCAMGQFVGIDLGREQAPDAATLLKFRRLLQRHELTVAMLEQINAYLQENGLLMCAGTMIDATIVNAPSSTMNKDKKRDPQMHSTKKRNQWYFGLKVHIGADADSDAVHSLQLTASNESDVANAHHLLHGQEEHVHADAGYQGVDKRQEIEAAQQAGRVRADVQ